jgi:hypothetical protein
MDSTQGCSSLCSEDGKQKPYPLPRRIDSLSRMNSSSAAELPHEGGTSTPTGLSAAPTDLMATQQAPERSWSEHDDSNNPTTNHPTPTAGAMDLQQHDHQQPDDEVDVRQHERIDAEDEPPQPLRPLPTRRDDDGDQEDNESARHELPPRVAAEDILLESSSPAAGSAPSSTSLLNREETRTLQWATTGLGILFVAVAVLTVLAVDQYRLVVLVGLLVIISAFYLLLRVVQHVTEHPAVLHPAVHHWMRAVRTEYRNFVQDWREHVLLLTYPDDDNNGNDPESGSPYRDMGDGDDDPLSKAPHNKRPKSRIFRALVHPLAPWLSRRKERRQQRRQEQNEQQEQQYDDEKPSIELQQKEKKPSSSRRQQRKQQQSAGDTKNRPNDPLYVPPDYALV